VASVPAGGPSTVNGVLYQLLYSLLTLGGFQALAHRLVEGQLEELSLVVEPFSGGDQQANYPGKRIVTQLKARSTGGSWSLQAVIRDVLPDLYRSVDQSHLQTEYAFVTEGEQGRWAQVQEFFGNLAAVVPPGDCLDALDDEHEIRFGHAHSTDGSSDTFWGSEVYTERRLFKKIVDTLRERQQVADESYHETCSKTWTLLHGFRFLGESSMMPCAPSLIAGYWHGSDRVIGFPITFCSNSAEKHAPVTHLLMRTTFSGHRVLLILR